MNVRSLMEEITDLRTQLSNAQKKLEKSDPGSGTMILFIARRAYCVEGLQKSMCVRPSDRPSVRPSVRGHQNGPDLVTRNWVLALVTPSSVTNSGSVRDAFDLVTRNWVLALVTRSSVTKSERFWSESWTGPDLWSSLHKKPFGRRAYCVERLQKSMCVRPSVRVRPCVRPCRPHQKLKRFGIFPII